MTDPSTYWRRIPWLPNDLEGVPDERLQGIAHEHSPAPGVKYRLCRICAAPWPCEMLRMAAELMQYHDQEETDTEAFLRSI